MTRSNRKNAEPPLLEGIDASLLDIVDHVLTKGIVLTGDLVLGVADIDLIYLRISAILCAADRVLGKPELESVASPTNRRVRAQRSTKSIASKMRLRRTNKKS